MFDACGAQMFNQGCRSSVAEKSKAVWNKRQIQEGAWQKAKKLDATSRCRR
jgi:hypothetical protein